MSKELPTLPPGLKEKIERFYLECDTILDSYVRGFELDMNRHAVKHGAMEDARAVNDLARILARDVPHAMMAGLLATAILKLIKRKKQGLG